MSSLQLSNVITCLKEEMPRLDFQASEVTMILTDKAQVTSFFQQPKDEAKPLEAEIYGFAIYHYSSFDLRLNWRVSPVNYNGVYGVNLKGEEVEIIDVELMQNHKIVRLHSQGKMLDEEHSRRVLEFPFNSYVQDWKLYPFLSANNMQPTHYKVKKEVLKGVEVDDITEINYKTYPQLKKYITEQGGGYQLVNTFFETVTIENHFVCMEGFSTYRLGREENACFAHLHWLVRGLWEMESQFEIAIVESEHLPGAFFTGINMIDNMDEGRDMIAIIRLLNFEQNWKREAVTHLKEWLKDKNSKMESEHAKLIASPTNNETKHKKITNQNSTISGKVRTQGNSIEPMQLGLFDEDFSNYNYTKYTVLDGHRKLKFSGLHIGQVVGNENANGEVDIFDLYKTDSNQWVGVKRQVSLADDRGLNNSRAEYLSGREQLFDFFEKEVAKDLYNQAQSNTGKQQDEEDK